MTETELRAEIERRAQEEFQEERVRLLVEAEKEKLRRPWWMKLFPWRLEINVKWRKL